MEFRYYLCQVRYSQLGELKSIIHREYEQSAQGAASRIQELLRDEVVVFNTNTYDQVILHSKDVVNVAVISGESKDV